MNGPEEAGDRAAEGRAAWIAAAAFLAVVLAAYLPALSAGFVWDDDAHVTGNALLRSPGGLLRIWSEPRSLPQYYPLVHTTFWIEARLWGLHPAGYHLVNVLLHGLGAFLLWKVLRRLAVPGAWIGALLFAVHPVHAESVAWVTERKNVLSGVLCLGSLLLLLRHAGLDADGKGGAGSRRVLAGAMGLFVAALLSKTVTASLPAAVLVLVWWKRGRIAGGDVRPLLPFLAAGIGAGVLTAWLERGHVGAEGEDWALTLADRVVLAGRLPWFYAAKLALPVDLSFVYPRWTVDAGTWWQWLFPAASAGTAAALLALRGRIGRGPLAAALLYAGVLFPALGFLNVYPFRYAWAADHFQYLASIALLAPAGAGLALAGRAAGARFPALARAPALAAAAILGVLTFHQCGAYRDLETLWRTTLERNPSAWMARNNLGVLELQRGRRDEAEGLFRGSLDLNPRNHEAWNNLGTCLLGRGDLDGAAAAFGRAIEEMPEFCLAWTNLGQVFERRGDPDRALECYRTAASFPRTWVGAHALLAQALADRGRVEEAVEACRRGLREHAGDPGLEIRLGDLLVRAGRAGEAVPLLEGTAARAPGSSAARLALGTALFAAGRQDRGLAEMEEAARLDPASSRARNNLGAALRRMGRGAEAEARYREAVRLAPGNEEARANLARLLAETGRMKEAEEEYRAGLREAPGAPGLRYGLAVTLASRGRMGEAAAAYRAALEVRPSDAPSLNDLAWILATSRDPAVRAPAEAVERAERLVGIAGRRDPLHLDTLAAAYAAAGRFPEAVRVAEEALALGPAPDLERGIRLHLGAYRVGRALAE